MKNNFSVKRLNEPYVIGTILFVIVLILYLVLEPLFSAEKNAAAKFRITAAENLRSLKGLPKTYSEITVPEQVIPESELVLKSKEEPLKTIDTDNPVYKPETVELELEPDPIKQKPVTIEPLKEPVPVKPKKKEATTYERAVIDGTNSGIAFPNFKPVPKKDEKPDGMAINVSLKEPSSKYIVQAGVVLGAMTISSINSDLPGSVIARLNRSVYDSVSGKFLLIPQGSKLIGSYDSKIKLNQKRIQVAWHQVKLPNGSSIDLGKGMPGTGEQGMSGLTGEVDNHYFSNAISIFSVALINSAVNQLSDSNNGSFSDDVSEESAENASDKANDIVSKQIQLGPTLKIKMGTLIKVMITKDLVFEEPYNDSKTI